MADDTSKGAWWHGAVIGTAMTLVAGVSNYVGSHWGGMTKEQADTDKKELLAKMAEMSHDIAKIADLGKVYTDEQIRAAEKRASEQAVPKKRKVQRDQ